MKMRDVGFWGGWALLVGIIAVYGFFALNQVTDVRYVTGVAGDVQPLTTESGQRIVLRVTVEGQTRDIRLPSQLVHPAKGAPVCLRAGEHRFTGHTSYVSVSDSLCDDTSQ